MLNLFVLIAKLFFAAFQAAQKIIEKVLTRHKQYEQYEQFDFILHNFTFQLTVKNFSKFASFIKIKISKLSILFLTSGNSFEVDAAPFVCILSTLLYFLGIFSRQNDENEFNEDFQRISYVVRCIARQSSVKFQLKMETFWRKVWNN